MKHVIGPTTSLCEICYRHIPAEKFQEDRALMISKTCPEHGKSVYMIEKEILFVESLENNSSAYDASGYVLEITDRCNLKCPHCYQVPDNKKIDKPLESVLDQIANFPDDGLSITLAGAEPTMRKDLFDLIIEIKNLHIKTNQKPRGVNILTNGVMLNKEEYVQRLIDADADFVTIGLNHPDYQGQEIHNRQLNGIKNCVKLGLAIKNINYTLESLDQITFILEEIQTFKDVAEEFRIRGGADIGRSPDEEKTFLSDIVYEVFRQCETLKYTWDKLPADDNIYHYTVKINGLEHRIIQWADAKNVDLDELQCGPWGSFVPNVPVTNLMHQVMLRDAAINNGMKLLDEVPERYIRK